MAPIVVTSVHDTSAPPAEVWRPLGDLDTWPSWAPIRSVAREVPGEHAPDGVGSIRALRTATGVTRERVTVYEPPERLAYELLAGLPLVDYRSEVRVVPRDGGGSTITWRSTFTTRSRRTAWFWRWFVGRVLNAFARPLARAAAREG